MSQTKDNNSPRYPIGIQDFTKLREGNFIYADKTAILYRMIESGGYFFISRPRRFGKSLMLSTLEAYYNGRRDLFRGLALEELTDDWETHPVLHLDLNNGMFAMSDGVSSLLASNLLKWEKEYGVEEPEAMLSIRFGNIIRRAYEMTGKKVVILIDEYDKPLLATIVRPELAAEFRETLKAFYSNLKTMDRYIEIAVITGVARFSKVSIFSDLNNLRDISFEDSFSGVCGITPAEIENYFRPGVEALADKYHHTEVETLEAIDHYYGGYHFSGNGVEIYNPFSLMNACAAVKMGAYWFYSGTPTFLVRLLERSDLTLPDLSGYEVDASDLESSGILSDNPIPSFYQSGYLTIKEYSEEFDTYTLDYPNKEVKEGFMKFLVPYYLSRRTGGRTDFNIKRFVEDVREGRIERFMEALDSQIANIPYSGPGTSEDHFQTAIYVLFTLLGYHTRMEERVSSGRLDLSVETDRFVYIFEFKIDKSALVALRQIHDRRYWTKYLSSGKTIFLIGTNFSTKTRTIDGVEIERLSGL